MTPLRLLFVVQRYGTHIRGGAEQAARAVAERLAIRGHHVEVLSTTAESYVDWSGDLSAEEVVDGVVVHRLSVRPLRDPALFDRLNHRLASAEIPAAPDLQREWLDAQGPSVPDLEGWLDAEAGRFDVVVFFTYLYETTTAGMPVAARHTATALVPCAHDELPLQLHAFDRTARLADAVLLLTPEEADLVQERFRLGSPQHVVGLGTDLDVSASDAHVQRFRDRLGLGDDPYLLYVGRIDPSKGTSWLVERFIELTLLLEADVHLVLLGQRVSPVADHPRVHVVSDAEDDERNAAMAGALALVHPSPHESFGMVVAEAWAQRTPVVAFGGNDVLRGHVERSGGGLLVTDGAELGAATKLLTDDDGIRSALGDAGHAHVTVEHAWDTVIDRWERALRQTADQVRSRPPIAAPSPAVAPVRAPVAPGPSPDRSRPIREDLPPEWLARPLAAVLGVLIGFCITGVGAAMAGWFRPAVVIPATLVVGAPLGWSAARALPRWASTRSTHVAAAALLVLVAAFTAHNLVNHGQHVATDRDPGVYLTTAKHLLEEGNLLVQGPDGPFEGAPNLSSNGAGFSPERRDTTLEPQFPHLTASLLAASGWVHELGMFLATPLVAGFALVCLYAFASLLAGPRWALAAVAVAGASMPIMVFSRDTYSEPIATALLFGGLWVLALADRSMRWVPWLLAGLLLGATCMARVDGYLNLTAVALALALHLRLRGDEGRRATWLAVGACGIGVAATSLLGFWDTAWLTGSYFGQSLAPRLPSMIGAAVAGGVVAFAVAPLLWRRVRSEHGGRRTEPTLLLRVSLWATSAAVVAFFAWGYWVRPDPDGLPSMAVEGVSTLSFLPQAKTLSFRWLTWYLSPFGVAVGVLGLLAALLALGRQKRPPTGIVAGLAAIFITTLLYLWTPNVTPDHPWAMRRFAAVAIPGLAIGVAVLAHRLWRSGSSAALTGRLRRPTARRAVQVVAGVAALSVALGATGATAAITWPVQDVRAQVPMRERIHQVCELAGDDAAILVPIDGILALMFSVPAGVWCGVPAAGGAPGLGPGDVARLAVAWEQEGRRLVVVSSSETPVMNTLLPTGIVAESMRTGPVYPVAVEPTIRERPERVVPDERLGKGPDGEIVFHVYPIDAEKAAAYLQEQLADPCAAGRRGGARAC